MSESDPKKIPQRRPLRTRSVARRLHRTEHRVRQLVRAGVIKATKTGPKLWDYSEESVDNYMRLQESRRAEWEYLFGDGPKTKDAPMLVHSQK